MRIVVAPDKFKHSLSATEVCSAIENGLNMASPGFIIKCLPMADGGDGLSDVLAHYAVFNTVTTTVLDPLFRPMEATYLISSKKNEVFIEMAKASGLKLLHPSQYNCSITTTYGTGELIRDAVNRGAGKVIIGIGGSATNDCGIGMAAALGYRFLDKDGKELKPVGENLIHICSIDASAKIDLSNITFQVACDVTNYLTGERGATKVYGPQKGATTAMVEQLEAGMIHFAEVVQKELRIDIKNIIGGGAAGGMGAGCVAFLGAGLIKGTDLVFEYNNAEARIKQADLVITGEGKIDEQTFDGKVVDAVTQLCMKYNKPVIALCGSVDICPHKLEAHGLAAAFSIINKPMSTEEALQKTSALLTETAFAIGKTLKI